MAVIELLWRSCCSPSMEAAGGLSARLKVRQWTQVLIDQSLLLGSSSKGVHVHDIVLTYLRSTQSALELRALQKRVVEGLLAASADRTAATGRGFQDTGSTAKAFDGEEVDWYVCNVASYHVKQSVDPSLPLVENGDLQRWLLLDDGTVVRAAAVAVGMSELSLLLEKYSAAEQWIEAAKAARALGKRHEKAALDLLGKVESTTTEAQQLELDILGSLFFWMRGGPEKMQNAARRQKLMSQNKSLWMDPLTMCFMLYLPVMYALIGLHPRMWDAGKIAMQDTVSEMFRVQSYKQMPLFVKAAEESVGARKECIQIFVLTAVCFGIGLRSTEQATEVHQQLLEAKWGKDGSILMTGCMNYSFDRHFMISQGFGTRMESFLVTVYVLGLAEYCGNVQQMVQLFEKQRGAMREYIKRGVPGMELPFYCLMAAPGLTGLELKALHPFGKDISGLLGSCEGRCTVPSDCEEWYGSADWAVMRAQYGEGISSKDGLHHMYLKPTMISTIQAILSLSLASMSTAQQLRPELAGRAARCQRSKNVR
jgi:hypothetical protein